MGEKLSGAFRWKAVTPSDNAAIEPTPDAIYVGSAGDIAMEGDDANSEVFSGVAAGNIYPFQPRKILATGTTATGIKAIYNTD